MCDSEIPDPDPRVAVKKPATMESPLNPSSPATNNAASGGLVYVRRRVDLDASSSKGTHNRPKEPTTLPVDVAVDVLSSAPQEPTSSSIHRRLDWEERYHHLQMLLNNLNDDSDQTVHLQMLWSLSSAELSKLAVDLEKRSIQFSLEEAREMQRVAALNVLGRSVNSLKSTSTDDGES